MDFEFENRFDCSKENLLHYIKSTTVRKRRWRNAIIMILALGYAVYAITPPIAITSFGLFLMCILLMLASIILSPLIALRSLQNALLKQEGTKAPNRTLQFGEHIRSIYDNDKKSIVYRQITEVVETRDMFILTDNRTIAVFALKNSFTYGTFEDFKPFILKKCHHAQYKKVYNFILPIAVKQY